MTKLRLLFACAALAAAPALPAAAGDFADANVIGFSPDGAYFAFEEYGIQDGSGFPYSNIYVIETATDSWVSGTPVRVLIEGDSPSLSETRFEAADKARATLLALRIGTPGTHAVANPVTEVSANPYEVTFVPRVTYPMSTAYYALRLTEKPLPGGDCPDMGTGGFKGFRLDLYAPDGTARVLNDDSRIPSSRNCPQRYGISDVHTYFPPGGGAPVAVILINVFGLGFEGPDRRFIAIATRL